MTKKTATPHRTNPLDRDGDGKPGGSLAGNQTAPMADATGPGDPNQPDGGPPNSEATQPESGLFDKIAAAKDQLEHSDDLTGDRTTPGDGADKLEAMERETDEANAATKPWLRDNEWIHECLDVLGVTTPLAGLPALDADVIASWSDDEAMCVETWTDACCNKAVGCWPPAPAVLEQWYPRPVSTETTADTFTPEEIAAGATLVVEQEGEASTTAADVATHIDPADPLAMVETTTAPVAVRLRELEVLVASRELYKSAEGYSATYGAPYIDHATVEGWVRAGLALDVPSAGNTGGVRVGHEARALVTRLRAEARAAT